MADPTSAQSPLNQLRELMDALFKRPRDSALHQRLSYELRMFGCVVRANIRDQGRALQIRMEELPDSPRSREILVEDIRQACTRFLDDLEQSIERWRVRFAADAVSSEELRHERHGRH